MNYDEFEAEMITAGWSLDQIEAMWQKHQQASEPDVISYQFTDADREDPTSFFEFMESALDGL